MAILGPPFDPKNPPENVHVGPLLREAHKLFSGGPKWGVLGGGQKVYVEKVYVPFVSIKTKGPGEEGAPGYCPKILLPKRANMVPCSFP